MQLWERGVGNLSWTNEIIMYIFKLADKLIALKLSMYFEWFGNNYENWNQLKLQLWQGRGGGERRGELEDEG